MKLHVNDPIMQNKVFGWIGLGTSLILILPFLAMRYDWRIPEPGGYSSESLVWSLSDFVIMGTLIFGMSSFFVLLARKINKKYRYAIAAATLLLFLYIWAELAVGIFTNLGS